MHFFAYIINSSYLCTRMMDNKAFNTQFWRFLLSSILIALSGCLGNIVDGIIVGNLIGEDGVSAINLAKPVVQFMFSMSLLLSSGAGMLIGIPTSTDTGTAVELYGTRAAGRGGMLQEAAGAEADKTSVEAIPVLQ